MQGEKNYRYPTRGGTVSAKAKHKRQRYECKYKLRDSYILRRHIGMTSRRTCYRPCRI